MLWYKIITSVFLCFLITGCGFSPVYVKNNKSLFNTQFRYIKIDPIQDRIGQQLRNELVKILHPTGAASPLKYSLNTTISIAKQGLAIKKSELATRSNLIVTANFIKEPGLEINRPDSDTAETQENAAILIAVGSTGEVWMDGRRIDVRQVKANVVKMLADNPQGSVVIQADEKAVADTIIKVMDGAREAGVTAISLASEPK